MKYVIWNKTQDKFWSENEEGAGCWVNRYYAKQYSLEELEERLKRSRMIDGSDDLLLAVIAVFI